MDKFYTYSAEQTARELKTDTKCGLSEKEAAKRLIKYGRNEILKEKKNSTVSKFAGQFNDFLIIILIIAAVISFATGIMEGNYELTEPIIILLIVVLNATIGVVQEIRAEKSLEALKKMSAPSATVIREAKYLTIPAQEVVPGDIINVKILDASEYDLTGQRV